MGVTPRQVGNANTDIVDTRGPPELQQDADGLISSVKREVNTPSTGATTVDTATTPAKATSAGEAMVVPETHPAGRHHLVITAVATAVEMATTAVVVEIPIMATTAVVVEMPIMATTAVVEMPIMATITTTPSDAEIAEPGQVPAPTAAAPPAETHTKVPVLQDILIGAATPAR